MTDTDWTFRYVCLSGLGLSLLSGVAMGTTLDKVDNWDVDGAHGTLYVQGALTESACRLAMSSAYQTVNLGNVGTGQLQQVGQTGTPVAVQLRLEDCLSGESRSRNNLGNLLWSPDMPAMKIRFLAPADKQDPRLAAVTGAKGIGLQLSNAESHPIILGQYSAPQLISPGQNQLTYYVTPVRTAAGLNAGAYYALLQFQVSYD
ncbi:fimbrial protein [Providencia burhodogranariea]|uniref:Fimbrial protein domain-containing protein n=1 Tax=Providencia burhodogranariea DSM 19968 TaxID=1141662 RepID=K8WAD5_9GAMM|nr:fimbrial protein [Providencia burhodogranariea]EKT54412.1 fimbrial protein domain-containing protein [Providencia burhodogranariea DSM 19968]